MVAEGGTIPGKEPFVLADLLQQASATIQEVNETIDAISGNAEHALQRIAMTTDEAHQLLVDISPQIRTMTENGSRISAQTEQIVTSLSAGNGTLGKLLNDDSLYQNAQDAAAQAKDVMANLRQVSDEARRAISDVRSKDGPAQGLFADMRATLAQTRKATADLADNMEAMKHNFFLRGFFNRRGYFDLDAISPVEYRNGVLENGKRKAMRIWLASSVLFEPGPDNNEVLSADGRNRIDSAMATYLRYLPTNPIVVEGYATDGTAGDRYRQSRDRAAIVREYVIGRYGLMPQHTGFIALGSDAQNSPLGTRWDGVSLALFLDTEALQFADQRASK
jgi:phospholipid/cholesterol/gamma-HCH transport system substrate-binding protein